jgi:CheY-like chemotaxis protein
MISPAIVPLIALVLAAAPSAHAASTPQDPPLPPQRTGLLYITGSGSDNVGEYLPDGTLLRTITNPNMQTPRGVAVDDFGNLAVVCQDSDRILILDLEGQLLQTVTHPDLTNGTGISRSAQGNWYVGNYFPGKVVIFDPSWNHLGTLSQSGMSGVNCISFDSAGGFAVSSALSNKLFLYNSAHQPQGVVTHATIGSPMSIAMDSTGSHFVSNGSTGVITQFDASWGYLRDFGTGVLSSPQGIAINEADQLTITNWTGGLVHRYDNSGNLLGSFPATGLTVARNAAWQTSRTQLAREGGVAAASQAKSKVPHIQEPSSSEPATLNILVAEDHPTNATIVRRMLEGMGHQVEIAGDGQAAVDAFTQRGADLILMDLQMPIMGGHDACRAIRLLPDGKDIPILALTAHATAEERQRSMDAGMDDHLTKPFTRAQLTSAIQLWGTSLRNPEKLP